MGMYTEFHFNVELKKSIGYEGGHVLGILNYMALETHHLPELPSHEFFETDRWRHLFTMDSYYFSAKTRVDINFDKISDSYFLCVRSNIKNYDSEIEKFIDWIMPYIDETETFLGFYRYEENDKPTLIYMKEVEQ